MKLADFPTRLRTARRRLGLSQKQLASHYGLTRQAIYYWERGMRSPSTPALILEELEADLPTNQPELPIEPKEQPTAILLDF